MFLNQWLDFYGPESECMPQSIECRLCIGFYYYKIKYNNPVCKNCMANKARVMWEQTESMQGGSNKNDG